jgi:hypothetical protein
METKNIINLGLFVPYKDKTLSTTLMHIKLGANINTNLLTNVMPYLIRRRVQTCIIATQKKPHHENVKTLISL